MRGFICEGIRRRSLIDIFVVGKNYIRTARRNSLATSFSQKTVVTVVVFFCIVTNKFVSQTMYASTALLTDRQARSCTRIARPRAGDGTRVGNWGPSWKTSSSLRPPTLKSPEIEGWMLESPGGGSKKNGSHCYIAISIKRNSTKYFQNRPVKTGL